eukprot:TRINITY_DN38381_c0_g1_i1.p1 TRINITY_DN38381_c0_g1~~TRINITY_DN38381_c0_g1_i1.p1  ORF type:complete len:310 (+),score=62.55 TRINITY_DN38381_c0_g1_i1:94-1023(+)
MAVGCGAMRLPSGTHPIGAGAVLRQAGRTAVPALQGMPGSSSSSTSSKPLRCNVVSGAPAFAAVLPGSLVVAQAVRRWTRKHARRKARDAVVCLSSPEGSELQVSQLDASSPAALAAAEEGGIEWCEETLESCGKVKVGLLCRDSAADGVRRIVVVKGDVRGRRLVPLRLHSECLFGDALGSTRCACGPQLQSFLEVLGRDGSGVLVYLQGHEGRGIGLAAKIRAYALQDGPRALSSDAANEALGFPADARRYASDDAMQLQRELGLQSARLYSSNSSKASVMADIVEEVVPWDSAHRRWREDRPVKGL